MSLATPQVGSSRRSIQLRKRGDLEISTTRFQGETSWIVKDPIALKYFRLREAEHMILALLDGRHSYDDIRRALVQKFPNKKFEVRDIQNLAESFHTNGLLLSNSAGQAKPLTRRRRKEQTQKITQFASSIVSIKFPGFDPEPLLAWLYPKVHWLFSKTATILFLGIIVSALLLVGSNLNEFQTKLPTFQQFFGFKNLVYLGFVLVFTKSIHELGHGLVCKHFNGECHEMGFMLMVLTPAMFCDTSDSWILPNKWHRIAIGAAGMWVEVVMAALATFIWWYTHPGWLHYFALNIMFLCSVATIVFNINPLLRYDGYYMLSDFLEIPNLSQKATLSLTDRLRVWCLGMEPVSPRRLPRQNRTAFAIYAISSFVYRWFVLGMIFWFITRVFEPYGLQVLGYLAVGIAITGSVLMPIYKAIQFFLYPGRMRDVNKWRLAISSIIVGIGIGVFFLVPFPHHVRTPFVVRPASAETIFVRWPGTLREIGKNPGDQVAAGDTIARLGNPDLEIKLEELRSDLSQQSALLEAYRVQDSDPLRMARLAGEAKANIARLKKQIEDREKQLQHLDLKATRNGFLIPPPNRVSITNAEPTLASWSGTPLEPKNISAKLERETLVCYVGDPQQMRAMLCVPQSEIKLMKADQPVRCTFNSFRGTSVAGEVVMVSSRPVEDLPRELSTTNGGIVSAKPQPDGTESPLLTHFEVAVQLEDHEMSLLPGMTGLASVRVGSASPASRLYRSLANAFKFQ